MTRIVGYCRVSTAEQAANGYGLDAQERAVRDACAARGWEIVDVIRDEGESGKSLERPGLLAALEMIARRDADGLLVAKLDRLTRSVIDFASLLEWCGHAQAVLVALDLGVDTSTPTGRLVAQVMAAVAEWEREAIAQRTRDGLAAARAQGRRIGRPSVADRPELVERIREMRASNMTLRAICDVLTAEGVPTVRGGAWRPSSIEVALGYRRRSTRRVATLPELRWR